MPRGIEFFDCAVGHGTLLRAVVASLCKEDPR